MMLLLMSCATMPTVAHEAGDEVGGGDVERRRDPDHDGHQHRGTRGGRRSSEHPEGPDLHGLPLLAYSCSSLQLQWGLSTGVAAAGRRPRAGAPARTSPSCGGRGASALTPLGCGTAVRLSKVLALARLQGLGHSHGCWLCGCGWVHTHPHTPAHTHTHVVGCQLRLSRCYA